MLGRWDSWVMIHEFTFSDTHKRHWKLSKVVTKKFFPTGRFPHRTKNHVIEGHVIHHSKALITWLPLFREMRLPAKISTVFRSDQPFKSYEQKSIIFLKNFLKNPYVNFGSKLLISRDIDHLESYKLHRCNQLVKARRMVPILTVLDQGIRYLKIWPKIVSN